MAGARMRVDFLPVTRDIAAMSRVHLMHAGQRLYDRLRLEEGYSEPDARALTLQIAEIVAKAEMILKQDVSKPISVFMDEAGWNAVDVKVTEMFLQAFGQSMLLWHFDVAKGFLEEREQAKFDLQQVMKEVAAVYDQWNPVAR